MTRKFQDVYIPALKANYVVWPAVQILNFRVMPIQFQIVSCTDRHVERSLTIDPSPLSPPSASCGRLTSPLPTPRTNPKLDITSGQISYIS